MELCPWICRHLHAELHQKALGMILLQTTQAPTKKLIAPLPKNMAKLPKMQWKQICPQNLMVTVSHKSDRSLAVSYYALAVDNTALVALSSLAAEQTTATTNMQHKVTDLLDYLATNPDATIQFRASNMILNIRRTRAQTTPHHSSTL